MRLELPFDAVDADSRDLVAPRTDRADAVRGTLVDDPIQRDSNAALLAHRRRIDRQPLVAVGKVAHRGSVRCRSGIDAVKRQQGLNVRYGQLGMFEQIGGVREPEQLGQVLQRSGALLAATNREVALVSV